jgi:phage tail sheath protein FI
MSAYLTPGIYLRPRPAERKDVRLVRTDVAGFVGFAERGPLSTAGLLGPDEQIKVEDLAVRLTSWKEYTAVFGGCTLTSSLAYAVRAFFENGGTTCHVVRVAAIHHPDVLMRPRAAATALPGGTAVRIAQLAQPTGKGEVNFLLDADSDLARGDLIAIENAGITEFAMVLSRYNRMVTVARSTESAHATGGVVYRYPAALIINATSAGNWGNRIRLDLTPFGDGDLVDQFSLRVSVDRGPDSSQPREEEFYKRLSLDTGAANDPYYAPNVVNQHSQLIHIELSDLVRRGAIPAKLYVGDPSAGKLSAGPVSFLPLYLTGGRDGLAGTIPLDFTGSPTEFCGLRILEEIDEVAILCAPDTVFAPPLIVNKRPQPPHNPCDPPPIVPPDPVDTSDVPPAFDDPQIRLIYRSMLDQCERLRDRVAILDTAENRRTRSAVVEWRNNFISRFGAMYYPWLKVPDPTNSEGKSRTVPPSGHVAGIYARTDNQFGVHHPPANAPLEFVNDVADEITALQQEELNPFSVNAIRAFNGRGIRVWGARSLAGKNDSDWRFIHARRLMSMIEESVYKSTQWTVFEPNDFALRRTIVHSLSVFLEAIWRQGGLKGALPGQGFYVRCDETNNPPSVVDAGQVVCQVGVAVAAPMEFIVFEIRQGPSGSEITEQ